MENTELVRPSLLCASLNKNAYGVSTHKQKSLDSFVLLMFLFPFKGSIYVTALGAKTMRTDDFLNTKLDMCIFVFL